MNTMLSAERSDIGAGMATATDEWGQTVYFYVLETALQTKSSKMQYDSYPILTAIARSQGLTYVDATQMAQSLQVSQYIMPVVQATARPDGEVIYEVKNGQSLWSIAIKYGVKIEQIHQLNHLSSIDLYPGQKLLVEKKSATQPAPTPTATGTTLSASPSPTPSRIHSDPSPSASFVATETLPAASETANSFPENISSSGMTIGVDFLIFLLAGLFSFLSVQRNI